MKAATGLVVAAAASVSAIQTITTQGNAFFAGSDRFYIRGVDYQPGGSSANSDPIADAAGCKRDIVEFNKLGINTIRVYTVDNTQNHDECMSALSAAGIYLALDVNTPKYSINRGDPAPSYNAVYLQSIFATIDAFAKYDNTLLFFSGNEVINSDDNTNCAPYVKAVNRDMKNYIQAQNYRSIPVGYSAADVESNRYEMAEYMNCGPDDIRSDFFAFNDYSWCDPSSYTISGWDQKVALFSNYSLPIFLSEYGCITNARTFQEVGSLYGVDMTPVYSGGLVYEYSEEGNGYGLVTINGDSVTEGSSFSDLMQEFADNMASGDGGYKTNGSASTCPPTSDTWEVTAFSGTALPAFPSGASKYLKAGAGTGPGLAGAGSQDAGTDATATASAGASSASAASSASGSASSSASSSATSSGASSGASSSSSGAGAASSTGAASTLRVGEMSFAPLVCGAVVLISAVFGATLL